MFLTKCVKYLVKNITQTGRKQHNKQKRLEKDKIKIDLFGKEKTKDNTLIKQ